jgi:hypothetical protein
MAAGGCRRWLVQSQLTQPQVVQPQVFQSLAARAQARYAPRSVESFAPPS